MLLGHMINMLAASRFVLFKDDGEKIGEYRNLEDAPDKCKNAFVTQVMSPTSTAFHNADGDMFITIKTANF